MYIAKTDTWYMERIIWMMAGVFALAGTVLSVVHSIYWIILPGIVGVNLMIFALTGFCVMANILYKLGAKPEIKGPEKCGTCCN
ncbi:MAG: DUF2892 domain-containing protein [Nitrospirota bacterium]|nr:DUF2892 domain-containing protein [Nitrospirota bacterium]